MARIKLLRNKREIQVKQMRKEISQLLTSGQEPSARIRVRTSLIFFLLRTVHANFIHISFRAYRPANLMLVIITALRNYVSTLEP